MGILNEGLIKVDWGLVDQGSGIRDRGLGNREQGTGYEIIQSSSRVHCYLFYALNPRA